MSARISLLTVVVCFLLGANWTLAQTDGTGITLRWYVSLGSVEAQPCNDAGVTLQLRDSHGVLVSRFEVSMELSPLGIGGEAWTVNVPSSGEHLITVVDHGCSEDSRSETSIPVQVSDREVPETIILLAHGDDLAWHLYYFGVIKKLAADGVLEFEEDPVTLTNVSSERILVCRMMLGPQVQTLELIGEKWREGESYEYPEGLDAIRPGQSVALRELRVRVFTVSPDEGNETDSRSRVATARLLKVATQPERGSYVYITDPPHGATGEPFIGFCDSYFVDLGGLSPRSG